MLVVLFCELLELSSNLGLLKGVLSRLNTIDRPIFDEPLSNTTAAWHMHHLACGPQTDRCKCLSYFLTVLLRMLDCAMNTQLRSAPRTRQLL